MEFYIDDRQVEEKFQQIFKKIMILRNGETHHEMKKFGLNYQKALGATIVNLRELAEKYQADHLLAHKLWTKGFRESKILATLLEEPEKVSVQQLERWFEEMDTNELLEQACMNLFIKLPNIITLLEEWLQSENDKKVLCAIMVMGRLAMNRENIDESVFLNFVKFLPCNIDELYLRNQLKRSLGKMVRLNSELAKEISGLVQEKKEKDENWQEVWIDLQYELEL